jgi:hypothetical protein
MVSDAASEAMNARAIGMRALDGVVGGIADGQPLEPLTPDDDHRLARRLRVLAENLRLTRAEAYDPTIIEYPLWPEPASEPVWQATPRPVLPINRKERYYTGTVLPAILADNRFLNLDLFLGMCGLPDVTVGQDNPWIEFVTEYGFAESVFTPEAKAQFPRAPVTRETPDVIIAGVDWLVVVEAKMFHRPGKGSLTTQFDAQKPVVEAIRNGLGIDPSRVRHGFLLVDEASAPDGADFVITWADIIDAYRGIGPDYWVEALSRAVDAYDVLKSQMVDNADGRMTGLEIVGLHALGELAMASVGRIGGLNGAAFAADVATGAWQAVESQVSQQPPPNANWMPVGEFLAAVESA